MDAAKHAATATVDGARESGTAIEAPADATEMTARPAETEIFSMTAEAAVAVVEVVEETAVMLQLNLEGARRPLRSRRSPRPI